jgi:hypothetical protein
LENLKVKRKDSDADYIVYLKLKKMFEPMTKKHLILSSGNIREMLNSAVEYIRKKKGYKDRS